MKESPLPQKPSVLLKGASRAWVFWGLGLWVLFVFLTFFFNLYSGWSGFFPVFPSSAFSHDSVDFIQRLNVWKDSFLALATGLLIMGFLWSSGKRAFKWFPLEASGSVRFCLEIGLGIFLFNCFWMGLGLTRLWVEPLWLVVFVFLCILFIRDFLDLYRKRFSFELPKGSNLSLLGLCVFYFVFLLLHSVLPETFYDSLNYFLGMPSFWLWHHGICDYPTHILSGYFHGGSLFFLNGFVLAGTEGAKVLAALVLFWIALFCYGWGKELAGPKAGAIAATAVLTFPLLYLNSWAVRVDGLLTLVLLLFFYSIEKGVSLKNGGRNWIVLSAIFMGLALSIKPTAIVALGAALLALLWRDGFKIIRNKGWLIFAGIQILEVGPWLVKNACFAGNAFFPYLISIMGGRQFPAWSYQRLLHENQQFLPMDHGILSILSLPWRFTIPGAGDDQFIGPILLAFLPLLFLLRFQNPTLKFLARTLLLSFVIGLTLSHMLRFSIPAFVLAFLILSIGLGTLKEGKWKTLWVGAVAVSAFLCVGQYFLISTTKFEGWGIWTGKESHSEYLVRKLVLSSSTMPEWVDQILPKNAQLLVVGDAEVLYYKRPVYANSVFDEQLFAGAARKEKNAQGILRRIQKLGISNIVFHRTLGVLNAKEYRQYELDMDQWQKIDDFIQRGLEPMMVGKSVTLYKVRTSLQEKSLHVENPFLIFPSQAMNFYEDFSNKNYSKSRQELNQLLGFFPGDPFWIKKDIELKLVENLK